MRPREQSRGQDDLFRSRLDQIIDMGHELVRLGGLIDWRRIGEKRGVTKSIKRELRRRAAVEPVIGHMKSDHRMDRNFLIGSHGDAANAVLAAVGYNFRRLAAWLRELLCALIAITLALGLARPKPQNA